MIHGQSQADVVTTVFRKRTRGSPKKPRKKSRIPARVRPAKGSATPNIRIAVAKVFCRHGPLLHVIVFWIRPQGRANRIESD